MKLMTQGKTLSASFSTMKGTFSIKTRKNLELKYLGARANSHSHLISSLTKFTPPKPKGCPSHLSAPRVFIEASSSTSTRSDPDPDALDEDELFAELEAEIENDDGPLREQGLKELQREYGRFPSIWIK